MAAVCSARLQSVRTHCLPVCGPPPDCRRPPPLSGGAVCGAAARLYCPVSPRSGAPSTAETAELTAPHRPHPPCSAPHRPDPLRTHTEIFTPQVGKKNFWCTITPLWQVFKLGPVVIVHLFSRFQYHVGVYWVPCWVNIHFGVYIPYLSR